MAIYGGGGRGEARGQRPTNAEIAAHRDIPERTVESHRSSLMTKLGLKSRAELVRFVIDSGLIALD